MYAVPLEAPQKVVRNAGEIAKYFNKGVAQVGTQLNQCGQIGIQCRFATNELNPAAARFMRV
jgi:hypothetical protein